MAAAAILLGLMPFETALAARSAYTVAFNANGAAGTMESITVDQDDEDGIYVTFPECSFIAPEDTHFARWRFEYNGSKKYYSPGDRHVMRGEDWIAYAEWEPGDSDGNGTDGKQGDSDGSGNDGKPGDSNGSSNDGKPGDSDGNGTDGKQGGSDGNGNDGNETPDSASSPDEPDGGKKRGESDTDGSGKKDERRLKGIYGDVDLDSYITSNDALMILRTSIDLDEFDELLTLIGNVGADKHITPSDALGVLRYSIAFRDDNLTGKPFDFTSIVR